MRKSLLEIERFMAPEIKELGFESILSFSLALLFESKKMVNDEEVSNLLYSVIDLHGFQIPTKTNISKFNLKGLAEIADFNLKPMITKHLLCKDLGVHKQTLNKWLEHFNKELFLNTQNERKLMFIEAYEIINSLGFTTSKHILNRAKLAQMCNLKSHIFKKSLSGDLLLTYNEFNKYPPVYSKKVLDFFDVN
jgi:hypothetical protein